MRRVELSGASGGSGGREVPGATGASGALAKPLPNLRLFSGAKLAEEAEGAKRPELPEL